MPTSSKTAHVERVDGQLIDSNRHKLKERIVELLAQGERKIVIDFSSCGYIDSSGCGVLVSISKKIRDAGGEIVLAGLNEDLRTLFELTKMDILFVIADNAERAVQHLERA